MKTILALSANDLQSTFRDPVFKGLLFFPFVAFVLIRWGVPYVVHTYPEVAPYTVVILMWGCLQSATMFGFMYGFLFLEEKEEQIWQVIRILPVSGIKLVFSRLLLGLLISTAVNFCLIHFGQIIYISFIKEILLSLQFSLAAPLIALALGALAKNRIEGLAQMKIVNVLLIMPALIYFIPGKAMHLTALIPTYWSYRSLEMAHSQSDSFMLFLLVGFALYLLGIGLLTRKMERSLSD